MELARAERLERLGDPIDGRAGTLLGCVRALLGGRDPVEDLAQAPRALGLLGLQHREPLRALGARLGLGRPRLDLLELDDGALERLGGLRLSLG